MESILPTNEYKEVDGRAYLNPEVALNEANDFIGNLRTVQDQQNQEIAKQTYNLGTSLPSAQGGLGTNNANNMSYFTSRFQTPQTESIVGDLRSAAQAAALNQVLANEQAMWQKKYNDAYRSYQKRSSGGSGGGSGGSGGNNGSNGGNESGWQGESKDRVTGFSAAEGITLDSNTPGDFGEGVTWTVNPATVGQELLEFIRVDTTKPLDDPERETLYRQKSKDDPTLVRVR